MQRLAGFFRRLCCSLITMSVDFTPAGLLNTREVAALLKISVAGVRRLQQGRHIPFLKVGGSVRFAKEDILAYLARHRVEAIGP